jgi:hypothetical protein
MIWENRSGSEKSDRELVPRQAYKMAGTMGSDERKPPAESLDLGFSGVDGHPLHVSSKKIHLTI